MKKHYAHDDRLDRPLLISTQGEAVAAKGQSVLN